MSDSSTYENRQRQNFSSPSAPSSLSLERARGYIEEDFSRILDELKELVSIPGIAWDSFDQSHVHRSAEAVARLAQEAGFERVGIYRSKVGEGSEEALGAPAVIAQIPASEGSPTVLLYAHHDVQPPQDASLWESEPFVATERDGRLYGRGAADDKAGVMLHIASVRALLKHYGGSLPVGVTLFIEGEEEAGSPSFRAFLEDHREELAADAIVVADSSNWVVGTPALTTSLRGLVSGILSVRVAEHASHSGMFGGPVLDAPTVLARAITQLHDEQGDVAVPGLRAKESLPAQVEYKDEDFARDAGLLSSSRLAGTGSLTERLWNRPALSVIGIDAPEVAVASNTLLNECRAKLSLRIPPGVDPGQATEALGEYIEALDIFGAEIRFIPEEEGQSMQTDTSRPFARTALACLHEAFGVSPVEIGLGGSIPFIADLTEIYPKAEILVTGVEDPDSRAHSANESLHIGDFRSAMVSQLLFLDKIKTSATHL